MKPSRILLASASPRRRELLAQIGVEFETFAVEADETPKLDETPEHYVQRVAAEKSLLAQRASPLQLPVLGADTEVVLDGEIFGKPIDFDYARTMLRSLSGREHTVLSAVSLRLGNQHWQAISVSKVTFRAITEAEISAYWQTSEPCDKAGAYAIQGLGAVFIERLEGSFSGVMGLPIYETAKLLGEVGVQVLG